MRFALVLALLVVPVVRLLAQVPDSAPSLSDTTRLANPSVLDTLRPFHRDSLGRDSLLHARPDSSQLQRYLAAMAQAEVKVLAPAPIGLEGPQPGLTRLVFTRDSIEWGHAATVSDLLQRVPGVYLWRGQWLGQPEMPNFQGRGATSVEYYLDGLPYVPAGVDSVGIDPGLFALSLLDRIEVERWPGLLRVRLFTRNNDRLAARSQIAVARGQFNAARVQASLEKRSRAGLGLFLAGDYLDVPTVTGLRPRYSNAQVMAQGSYLPSPHWGFLLQGIRSKPVRDPLVGQFLDTLVRQIARGNRTDLEARVLWRADTSGLGARADLLVGHTSSGDSLTPAQHVEQIGVIGSYRLPLVSLGGSAFWRSRWTSLDLRGNGAWIPIDRVTVSGEAVFQRHEGGRSSAWLGVRGGVQLPQGLSVSASARVGRAVAAPALLTDSAQTLRDWQLLGRWQRRWAALEAGFAHTSAFQPQAYQPFAQIVALERSSGTDWLTTSVRLQPLSWMTLEGWYSNPRGTAPNGLPPRHMLGAGTIRTRLQRVFPSGVLNVKLRLAVEHWSDGVIGRDATDSPIILTHATYFRSLVEVALGSLQVYWDRGNLTRETSGYVPGIVIPARQDEVGIRWAFTN